MLPESPDLSISARFQGFYHFSCSSFSSVGVSDTHTLVWGPILFPVSSYSDIEVISQVGSSITFLLSPELRTFGV